VITLEIPGRETIALEFLLVDVNGTLSDRGELIDGVEERLDELRTQLRVELLSADTFATLESISTRLSVPARIAATAEDKLAVLEELGAHRCVAVGNGSNDARILADAAVGIAVIGPEGVSSRALLACGVACRSIGEALDLLREPQMLAATLRP